MAVDARTEEFQHIEVFDKFALFTNARIDRTTVPEGWYCYDFRGTGNDPGELRFMLKTNRFKYSLYLYVMIALIYKKVQWFIDCIIHAQMGIK